tara:strand:- start:322 stop:651 length:330 start_codon:yes stop_codon:yes gene_type:complete
MKKIKLNIFIVFGFILLLNSCQSAKEGLLGGKRDNTDEFLVEKKNPLVLPPEFSKLPKPSDSKIDEKNNASENNKIEKLIGAEKDKKTANKSSQKNSLENSILKTLNDD